MSFKDEPFVIKIYIFIVAAAGAAFLAYHLPTQQLLRYDFLFFVLLHILIDHLDVPLPRGNGAVSVSFAIDLAIIIVAGPAAAAWAAFSTFMHIRTFKRFSELWHKMLFNAAQMALTAGIAGYAYISSGGASEQVDKIHLNFLAIIVAIFMFFFVNTLLVLIAVSLSQEKSVLGVWLTNIRWAVPNYLATAPLGILIAVIYVNMGILGVLLLMIPLMIARHTFIMYVDMRNQYTSTIRALTKAIDAKDHYTHGHSERVAKYTVWIGQEMNVPDDYLEHLEYLALMHDIGKVGIPEQILNKPTRLSDEEFSLVQDHAAVGADIISGIQYIGQHADIVRHHHERVDGRGYPDGITGNEMSLGAKIVGVADAYDAMTSQRIYRQPMSNEDAVAELLRCANSQFDEDVVKAFVKVLQRKGEVV